MLNSLNIFHEKQKKLQNYKLILLISNNILLDILRTPCLPLSYYMNWTYNRSRNRLSYTYDTQRCS